MTWPGDEVAAAGGRGRLRASHADREQVIDMLKAAFVQGRLAKGELDARLSQTFASRTYAELAALTADLPAGLAGTRPPRQPARAPARPAMSKVIAGAALLIPPAALLPPAFLTGNDKWAKICLTLMFFYLIAWMIAGTVMLDSSLPKRSPGQLPPPSAPHGRRPNATRTAGSAMTGPCARPAAVPGPATCPVTGPSGAPGGR
jgi:hypothetical protein